MTYSLGAERLCSTGIDGQCAKLSQCQAETSTTLSFVGVALDDNTKVVSQFGIGAVS